MDQEKEQIKMGQKETAVMHPSKEADRLRDPDPLSILHWGQKHLYGSSNYWELTRERGTGQVE